MLKNFLTKLTGGDATDKALKRILPLITEINDLEPEYEALSDAELRAKTDEFRAHIREATGAAAAREAEVRRRVDLALDEDDTRRAELLADLKRREKELFQAEQACLDELLPEAFAAIREAAKRTIGQRHYDVQLIGGAVLHSGKIAEMRTGEGKTLVSTFPTYLNALLGHGVHVVTTNDYLARRDAAWMGPIYHKLGLTIGVLQGENESFMFELGATGGPHPNLRQVRNRTLHINTAKGPGTREISDRSEAYQADITYGTNNEFGFDYLRDNLAYTMADRVQRRLAFAIVDEVDNIFIDEARTPLIISGFAEEDVEEYRRWAEIVSKLDPSLHYTVNEKERHVDLTTQGLAEVERVAEISNLYDEANTKYVHHIEQALSARALFLKGREYIVQRGQVVLVDEHTGRLMADRRLSDGLHQAIEAKENVAEIRPRMVTQATITIQNYFRMYRKLCGMTGTAKSEEEEFLKIYNLEVVVIPTNVEYQATRADSGLQEQRTKLEEGIEQISYIRKGQGTKPVFYRRLDYPDAIYRTGPAKWGAIVSEVAHWHEQGRPLLIGTTSVEKSESLGAELSKAGIPHKILNAKYHAEEAVIIARAGELGAVTVATNMAGRGVDIRLGGELTDETIHEAQSSLRRRGIDPFRVSDEQFYTAIAEVDPAYVRNRNKVLELGGLHVIGTERHDARRIDNQLRGRSGRQGEPGSSRFYVSLEDDMMRVFGGDRIDGLMKWALGDDDTIPLEHVMVTRALDTTQSRVEGYHFDTRKHVLEYDDVLNRQRDIIYGQRLRILAKDDVHEDIWRLLEEELSTRQGEIKTLQKNKRADVSLAPLFGWLEQFMPATGVPPQTNWRYPFQIGSSIALPSFAIWFTANRVEGSRGTELIRTLNALIARALTGYREEILATAIEQPLEAFFESEKSGLDELATQLEEKAEEYILWQQEQEKDIVPAAFATHIKRVFAPFKNAPFTEIAARDPERARKELLPYLEHAYYRQTTLDLLSRVFNASQTFRADWVMANEYTADLLDLAEQARDDADNPRTQKDLERVCADLEQGAGADTRTGKLTALEVLVLIGQLGTVPIGPLSDLLRTVVSASNDRWATRQRAECEKAIETAMARVREGTRNEIVQLLLDSLYVMRQIPDPRNQRQMVVVPFERFMLSYLSAAAATGLSDEDLLETIRAVTEEAVEVRETAWGTAEFKRLSTVPEITLGALETPALESLGRFWGQSLLAEYTDTRVNELPPDIQTTLRHWLALRATGDTPLLDWPDANALVEHLAHAWSDDVMRHWRTQDEATVQDVEHTLRVAGAFENPDAERDLLARTLAEFKPAFTEGLALRLGRQVLDPLRFTAVRELPGDLLDTLRTMLTRRGVFNDEKRVQHFLVEQHLHEFGTTQAQLAVRGVAAQRLKKLGALRIVELDEHLQTLWRDALYRSGRLVDPARSTYLRNTPLGQLPHAELDAIAGGVGHYLLGAAEHGGDLPAALQARAVTTLARGGHFGPLPVGAFGPDLSTRVGRALRDEAHAAFERVPLAALPVWLKTWTLRWLDEHDYFLEQSKAQAIFTQPLGVLDSRLMDGLEKAIGAETLAPLQTHSVQALDGTLRDGIVRFCETRGLRKKDQRNRVLGSKLSELNLIQKGLYDDVTGFVGRERLNPARNTRVNDLTGELKLKVHTYLRMSEALYDSDKRELTLEMPARELDAPVYRDLRAALEHELTRIVDTIPLDALPADLLERVDKELLDHPVMLTGERQAAFATLRLSDLPHGTLDAIELAIGMGDLRPRIAQPLTALDGGPDANQGRGHAAWHALEAAGLLIDPEREQALLQRRLDDLAAQEPDAYAAAVAALTDWLYNETQARRVADLQDDVRQGLREALDQQQVFVDQQAVRTFEAGRLSDLRAPDYEACALAVGQTKLNATHNQLPISAWPETMRAEVIAHARTEGLTLDHARVSAFRERGPAALPDYLPALHTYAHARLERAIGARSLNELSEGLRRHVETYLEVEPERSASAAPELARIGNQRLNMLDPDLQNGLAGFWGRRHVAQLQETKLAHCPDELAESLTEFCGRRMRQTLEKNLMLAHISRLWIDYLTEIEHLRQGIGLQAFGQRDPLVEYKRRAFQLFDELRVDIRRHVVGDMFSPQWLPTSIKLSADG